MDNWLVKVSAYAFATFVVFAGIFMYCAIISFPFWLLWNWLATGVFGLPEITWIQALGMWAFVMLLKLGPNINKQKLSLLNETDGTEPTPFGDLSWNQWVEQVRKKYQA